MKKFLSAVLTCAFMMSAAVPVCAETNPLYDVNLDGKVDSRDYFDLKFFFNNENKLYKTEYDSLGIMIKSEPVPYSLSSETEENIRKLTEENGLDDSEKRISFLKEIALDFLGNGIQPADVDRDGLLTIADSQLVVDAYAEIMTPKYDILSYKDRIFITQNCDYDGDGLITAMDSVVLIEYIISTYEMGDFNMDGEVNSVDASRVLRYYANRQTGTPTNDSFEITFGDGNVSTVSSDNRYVLSLADVDKSGTVDAVDASLILSKYSKNQLEKVQ